MHLKEGGAKRIGLAKRICLAKRRGSAKQRLLQSSMFPAGVAFDGAAHRTPVTASFLEGVRQIQEGKTGMASPTGRVVYPGWC